MKILAGVLIFSIGCTVAGLDSIVSLISMTMLIVSISQYIGMIKYNIEKRGGSNRNRSIISVFL